ncbi:hypothetical protein WJX73_006845 [Symbiochloris irregularis]|uniref:Uncharacterized protein n=1 Tax=Symbiochloris irregularis TaxID=706552 RepID=A0AAW1NI83_9CHLO
MLLGGTRAFGWLETLARTLLAGISEHKLSSVLSIIPTGLEHPLVLQGVQRGRTSGCRIDRLPDTTLSSPTDCAVTAWLELCSRQQEPQRRHQARSTSVSSAGVHRNTPQLASKEA